MVQACEKSSYNNIIKLLPDTSEVKIRVRDSFTIQITPGKLYSVFIQWLAGYLFFNQSNKVQIVFPLAFRCSGLWPRSANHWPQTNCPWPPSQIVQEVKSDGFDLLSKECINTQVSIEWKFHKSNSIKTMSPREGAKNSKICRSSDCSY